MMWSRELYHCLTSCRPWCSQAERSPEPGEGVMQHQGLCPTHCLPKALGTRDENFRELGLCSLPGSSLPFYMGVREGVGEEGEWIFSCPYPHP